METRRLKNIAILILLLLNGFLLLLLGYQELVGLHAEQEAMAELKVLFASEELTLDLESSSVGRSLSPLTLARKMESEASIAAFLLGETASMRSEGGGIYSYSTNTGTVQFRLGGGFDTVRFSRPVEDAQTFVRQFCDKFGYEDISGELVNGSGSLTATQYVARVPIFGCEVTLTFENGSLVSAAGAHIDLGDAQTEREEPLSGVSVLARFFDHRNREGIVCREVNGLMCVYQLQSGSDLPRLLPVWIVETDTYSYLVDGMTGRVSRK